jgi:carbon-monoxide dehydrogenase large subunit
VARAVVTNTAPISAYRGAGRPEAAWAMERAIERFAAAAGLDEHTVRRRNLVAPEAFPHDTTLGVTYDTGDYATALDAVAAVLDLPARREEQAVRRAHGDPRQLGIGLCSYVESTAGPHPGSEHGRVVVTADGAVTVYTGTSPHGQGHDTSWAMIVSEVTGIAVERVTVVHGDTDRVPVGTGTFGSRSLQLGGAAVHGAAVEVVERARRLAAEQLEAAPDDVVLDAATGAFHVAGTPARSRSWAEVVAAAGEPIDAAHVFQASAPTYPFGAHGSVVEVDVETGAVRLLRHVSVDDAGCVLNPLIVEGQRHGGIAQGIAEVLLEEFRYDADGNPLTTNFADYTAISAAELPSFELLDMETPTPVNPLGAKGIGESGTTGSMPAVHAAVLDALSHLGVTDLHPPVTPEKIWRAVDGRRQ